MDMTITNIVPNDEHIYEHFDRDLPGNVMGLFYPMLFEKSYRVPSVFNKKLIGHEISDQIELPSPFTTEDFLNTIVDLQIESIEQFSDRMGDISSKLQKRAEKRMLASGSTLSPEDKKLLKDSAASLPSSIGKIGTRMFDNNIFSILNNVDSTKKLLKWVDADDIDIVEIIDMLNMTKKIGQGVVDGLAADVMIPLVETTVKDSSLLSAITGLDDSLFRHQDSMAVFPAYYVHSRLLESPLVEMIDKKSGKVGKKDKFFSLVRKKVDDMYSFHELKVKDSEGILDDILVNDIIAYVETFEDVLLLGKPSSTLATDRKGQDGAEDFTHLSFPELIPQITRSGRISKVKELHELFFWTILTDKLFSGNLSASHIAWRSHYDKKVDRNVLMKLEEGTAAINTVYETLIMSLKMVASFGMESLKRWGAIPDNDVTFSNMSSIGRSLSQIRIEAQLLREMRTDRIEKRFERFKNYRQVKSAQLIGEGTFSRLKTHLVNPWQNVDNYIGIQADFGRGSLLNKPYNPMTPKFQKELLNFSKWNVEKNLTNMWQIIKMEGKDIAPISTYSSLSDFFPVHDITNIFQKSIPTKKEPEFYFFADIPLGGLMTPILDEKISTFRKIISRDKFESLPKYIQDDILYNHEYDIHRIENADDLFDRMGGHTTFEEFSERYPSIVKHFFNKNGTPVDKTFYFFNNDPFVEIKVVVDESVVHYNDYVVLKNSALLYSANPSHVIRTPGLIMLDKQLLLDRKTRLDVSHVDPKKSDKKKNSKKPVSKNLKDPKAKKDPKDELETIEE